MSEFLRQNRLVKILLIAACFCALNTPVLAQAQAIPPGIRSQFVNLSQGQAHSLHAGQGEPILMLHGLPAHAGLWRNILPAVSAVGEAVALDFLGYGQSDKPLDQSYQPETQIRFLSEFIDAHDYRNLTLVVSDLGSAIGIAYALRHPEKVKRLVLLEGVFMPAREWMRSITPFQQMMFAQMQIPLLAQMALEGINPAPLFLQLFTQRELSQTELDEYARPFADTAVRRAVLLKGLGPATVQPDGQSRYPGDFSDLLNRNAEGIKHSTMPVLLLTADPGFLVQEAQIQYARQNISNLTIQSIGSGIHFVQEDQPERIARSIATWIVTERVREILN